MSLKSKAASIGIAAAILAGTIVPTLAAQAIASTTLNVRSCASTSCRVVDVLRRGERVEVEYCRRDNWCFISHRGPDGFVNARYLSRGYDRYFDDDFYDDDFYIYPRRRIIRPYDPGVSVCLGGPNARFCIYD